MPKCPDCGSVVDNIGNHKRWHCLADMKPLSPPDREGPFTEGHAKGCTCFRCYHHTRDTVTWRRDTDSYAYATLPRRISGDRVVSDVDVTADDERSSSEIMGDHAAYRPYPTQFEAEVLSDREVKLRARGETIKANAIRARLDLIPKVAEALELVKKLQALRETL